MTREITEVSNLSDFIQWLRITESVEQFENSGYQIFYRGQDKNHKMIPGVFRQNYKAQFENRLVRELLMAYPAEFASDTSTFQKLVRMQHHRLPTRLLDVTANPLVALYFSCEGRIDTSPESIPKEKYSYVYKIKTPSNMIKLYDSDSISCLSNLCYLSHEMKVNISKMETLEQIRRSKEGKLLLERIRMEKPGFTPRIRPKDLRDAQLVRPLSSHPRLNAQQGAFIVFGSEMGFPKEFEVSFAKIKASKRGAIVRSLDKIGINIKTLFPDLDSASRYSVNQLFEWSMEDILG